jgi:hypothetical protein
LRDRQRKKPGHSTSANGAIAIASSAMAKVIRIFAGGQFDQSRLSSRECPTCGGTLYLSEVDHTLKVETWECAELECEFSEDTHSPPSR